MARVVRFHATGAPEVMQIEQLDVGAPGPGELKVRIEAIGLNRAEAMFRAGAYLEAPVLPARIGYEASATVLALGEGVTGYAVGEAISVIPAFSMNAYGVYADEAIVPAYGLRKRPAGLSPVEAAGVWMAYLTAWGALIEIAGLKAGEAAIITAASSSVGIASIQTANAVGATSIAVTRTRAKVADLKAAGAAHVIVTDEQDLSAEVMRITGGKGARVAFDPVGGPQLMKLAEAAAPGGIIIEYGALSTEATPYPLFLSLLKALTIRGYTLFEFNGSGERLATAEAFILAGLKAGTLKPVIAKTFPLSQIADAHRYLESNQQFGKVVVTTDA